MTVSTQTTSDDPLAAGALPSSAQDTLRYSLHPDCPDWKRLSGRDAEAGLHALAKQQRADAGDREKSWRRGFSRRSLLKGGLGVGVAALASQLVTTRVSYAAPGAANQGTLVNIFLRGGLDGLSALVPADDRNLLKARPDVAVRARSLIQLNRGFGLHPAMAPLKALIDRGLFAAIPAISTPDLSRSHFQAQDCLERGSDKAVTSGWLDRVLEAAGPGTTFRSVAVGGLLPRSLAGSSRSLSMRSLGDLSIDVDDKLTGATAEAITTLYTGIDHPVAAQSMLALEAMNTAANLQLDQASDAAKYPDGDLGRSLADLAALIKSGTGVRVACVDVGGWDMHTGMGNIDGGDMTRHLADLAAALAAFTNDLGPALDTTTIITKSEFGRRLEQNGSGGTDHGHGGVLFAMGGGVRGGVHGDWPGLDPQDLDYGDVPGANDYRDALTEIVSTRLGIGIGAMNNVFPGWTPTPVGIMT